MGNTELYKKLEKKFSLFRLFIILILLPLAIYISNFTFKSRLFVVVIIITIIYLFIVLYASYNRRKRLESILKITIYIDIALISLFVYLLGGIKSDAYFLFYLIILCGGMKHGYRGTILSLIQIITSYFISIIIFGNFNLVIYLIRIIYLLVFSALMYEVTNRIRDSHLKEKEAKELAYKDSLTQLPNRLLMSDKFETMRINYFKTGKSFGISIIDIDNFKSINDSKGHAFGDKVLIKLSQLFIQCLGDDDFICRFGGEEFLVFFSDEDKSIIYNKAKNICDKIKKYDFYGEKITVSIGISIFNNKFTMIENISFADEAMYAVKNTGKNKVMLYDDLRFTLKQIS